ncbi:MAG: YkgJ family cysteine cluster protein [Pseudomonadota bacterium]|nr:YkgJ family cysteine cluster protein [Pseudomonadota bacterium]
MTSTPAGAEDPAHAGSCLKCGACCAAFRVSFYWAEPEAAGLPVSWTQRLTPFLAVMAGTSSRQPRCVALAGVIGDAVHCGAYANRPSPCRAVAAGDPQCQRARARHGLPALDWRPQSAPEER